MEKTMLLEGGVLHKPKNARKLLKVNETRKNSPLESSETVAYLQHDLGLLSSRTVRICGGFWGFFGFLVFGLSCPVFGNAVPLALRDPYTCKGASN